MNRVMQSVLNGELEHAVLIEANLSLNELDNPLRLTNYANAEIILANSAQGKGRVERSFDTFQDRLVPERRLKRIKRMESSNRYLQETFIPDYWEKRVRVNPQNSSSEFTPVPKGTDLDAIFVVKDYRKIRMDHTFSYGNKFYLIDSPLRHSIAKQKIEIRTNHEDGFTAYFADRELVVSKVIEPTKPSMLDLDIQKKLGVLELAEQLGNVSEASRLTGVSRDRNVWLRHKMQSIALRLKRGTSAQTGVER